MNSSQVRSTSRLGALSLESQRTAACAGPDRLVRVGVVIFSSAVFGGWVSRHQLRHLHITSVEQTAGDTGKQNQHQSEHSGTVEGIEHVSSC